MFNKDSFISTVCLPFQKLGQAEIKTTLCTAKNDISAVMLYYVLSNLYGASVKEHRP